MPGYGLMVMKSSQQILMEAIKGFQAHCLYQSVCNVEKQVGTVWRMHAFLTLCKARKQEIDIHSGCVVSLVCVIECLRHYSVSPLWGSENGYALFWCFR